MERTRFAFEFDPRFRRILAAMTITPERSWVEVTSEDVRVRFGPWRLETPASNICCTKLTGPYSPHRAIGPRISVKDRGLSFGSNVDRGVCVMFDESVPGGSTLGLVRHPGLTVTVADPSGLIAAIDEIRPRPISRT